MPISVFPERSAQVAGASKFAHKAECQYLHIDKSECCMNRLKLLRFLFALSIVLAVIFGVLLIIPSMRGYVLGRIGLWCGLVSQFLLAVSMYSEIRRDKKKK